MPHPSAEVRAVNPCNTAGSVGGPPLGSRKKIFFFAGRPQKKLRAKVNVFARPRLPNRRSPLTLMSWQTTPSARIASSCTWESVHVSTIRHDAYYCECRLVGGILIRPNPGEWFLCCTADRDAFSPPRVVRKVARRQSSSLPCQHCINPPPNTLPLNGARGLRVHRRLAAELGKKIN